MRFSKIKYDGKKVALEYDDCGNEYTIKCIEKPSPEFEKALQALAEHVVNLCELPADYIERITVKSVSLNYGGPNDTMGATITSTMQLQYSNCPLNLNTPNKPVEPYNESQSPDEADCLSDECVGAIDVLLNEAVLYIKGERAQGSLFDDKAGAA